MPSTPADTIAAGLPVEIGKVGRELKKLWEQGGEKMCRASLMNLAVCSEVPGSLAENTQLIAQITLEHACRAIVIEADPGAGAEKTEAWISAHCHVSRAGNKQICSEQLSFSLGGSSARLLPNIIFAHLDTDLPLYLWWQGEFHDPMDAQLWSWVDRLIYDSNTWSDFDAQMRLVEAAQEDAKQRVVLCDLNWTRLVQLRLAVAQFFDSAVAQQQHLTTINRVEVGHAKGYRSTALLLIGWMAAQLGWQLARSVSETAFEFAAANGEMVTAATIETVGEAISSCSLFAGDTKFRVVREPGADLLEATVLLGGAEKMQQLLPAGNDELAELMSEELMRGGPHRVYLRAVQVMRSVL